MNQKKYKTSISTEAEAVYQVVRKLECMDYVFENWFLEEVAQAVISTYKKTLRNKRERDKRKRRAPVK